MTLVLIVSFSNPSVASPLASTLLWRGNVRRLTAETREEALRLARLEQPRLVVVDASDHERAISLLRELRNAPETRTLSLAALRPTAAVRLDDELREAGANLVLAGDPIAFLWDTWLEELLSVPRRKATRIEVSLEVWTRDRDRGPTPRSVGHTVNVSERGFLLETSESLPNGSTLDLEFRLPPDDRMLAAVGQVVRQAGSAGDERPDAQRCGIKLLRLPEASRERLTAFVETGLVP